MRDDVTTAPRDPAYTDRREMRSADHGGLAGNERPSPGTGPSVSPGGAVELMRAIGLTVYESHGPYGWTVQVWRGMSRVAWGLGFSRDSAAMAAEEQMLRRLDR